MSEKVKDEANKENNISKIEKYKKGIKTIALISGIIVLVSACIYGITASANTLMSDYYYMKIIYWVLAQLAISIALFVFSKRINNDSIIIGIVGIAIGIILFFGNILCGIMGIILLIESILYLIAYSKENKKTKNNK